MLSNGRKDKGEQGSQTEARRGLGDCFGFYSTDRPHQALGYRTPAEVHFGGL